MSDEAEAYLLLRREDGYGDTFTLNPGHRYTLGRATTNRIVLKDELCSREHAEVYYADGCWHVRDLKSLNGTRLNDKPLEGESDLAAHDEVHLGHSRLVFVTEMSQLPNMQVVTPEEPDSVAIKKRLGHTRFLTPLPVAGPGGQTQPTHLHHNLNRELSLLYRLALDMGSASNLQELAGIVLTVLLEATPADVGAILMVKDDGELELLERRHRDPSKSQKYNRISQYVSNEVLSTREAVLAEDVAGDRHLRARESLTDIGATSLICAPAQVVGRDPVLALVHLYCGSPNKALDSENLEFAMAVAKHLGNAIFQMNRQVSLSAELQVLRDQLHLESELVGTSPAIKALESQIGRVADTNATVLIRGESGSGKELVARAVHNSSPRKEGPFVCLNCAALTETLLESELFGHEKGAFTGATDKKIGKFEAADRGTIFLDEIGEMTTGTQAKLLRILEGHPFERVGGNTPIKVNVRVVSATNQPLEKALQEGKFRRDLFFRLQVVELNVPPLRERRSEGEQGSDITLLAEHFLNRFIRETGRKIRGFTPTALRKMEEHHWPGNVRELRNVIERAVALGNGPMLDAPDIWLASLEANGPVPITQQRPVYHAVPLDEIEKQHILQTLQHTDWNKSQAATILNIERSTLDRKIKSYDLRR
jgi:Nif-specific regulatory protein